MEPLGEPSHHHGAGQVLLMEPSGEPSHHHGAGQVLLMDWHGELLAMSSSGDVSLGGDGRGMMLCVRETFSRWDADRARWLVVNVFAMSL